MEILQIVLLRFLSAPSLWDLSMATDGHKSHVPRYYFSLKCCSAACLTVLTRALYGQRPCPLWGHQNINKWGAISQLPLLFISADVRARYLWHLWKSLEDLERWRLIDELGESSNMAQPSVSEPCLCQTAESACLPAYPPARLHIQALANLVNTEWLIWWHGAEYKCLVT